MPKIPLHKILLAYIILGLTLIILKGIYLAVTGYGIYHESLLNKLKRPLAAQEQKDWQYYQDEPLGFALKYPQFNYPINQQYIFNDAKQLEYSRKCTEGRLTGCGGLKPPNHSIDFTETRNNKILFSVDLYQSSTRYGRGLNEQDFSTGSGLTGSRNIQNTPEKDPQYNSTYITYYFVRPEDNFLYSLHIDLNNAITIDLADKIARTFEFTPPKFPLACQWSDVAERNYADETPQEAKTHQSWVHPVTGYFYDMTQNRCRKVKAYGYADSQNKTLEQITTEAKLNVNIPFSTLEACQNTCPQFFKD